MQTGKIKTYEKYVCNYVEKITQVPVCWQQSLKEWNRIKQQQYLVSKFVVDLLISSLALITVCSDFFHSVFLKILIISSIAKSQYFFVQNMLLSKVNRVVMVGCTSNPTGPAQRGGGRGRARSRRVPCRRKSVGQSSWDRLYFTQWTACNLPWQPAYTTWSNWQAQTPASRCHCPTLTYSSHPCPVSLLLLSLSDLCLLCNSKTTRTDKYQ